MLPGVVNIHRSTHELLDRILEGQAVPDLDKNPIPVLVSAFDVTRREYGTGSTREQNWFCFAPLKLWLNKVNFSCESRIQSKVWEVFF